MLCVLVVAVVVQVGDATVECPADVIEGSDDVMGGRGGKPG